MGSTPVTGWQAAVVAVIEESSRDVWVYDEQRDAMTRLTFGGGHYYSPIWSPDGRYVVFGSYTGMFWARTDGARQPQPFTPSKNFQEPGSFSPDGKRLAYDEWNGASGAYRGQIWTVPVEDSGGQLTAGSRSSFSRLSSATVALCSHPTGNGGVSIERVGKGRSVRAGISAAGVRARRQVADL